MMQERTKLGLGVLGVALALGVLGDGLLRATPWGINVPVWTAGLVAGAVALVRWRRVALTGEGRWLILPALLSATARPGGP